MLSIVSPGLKKANNATVKACVPDINWPLTIQSSALKTSAKTFSIFSLPISP